MVWAKFGEDTEENSGWEEVSTGEEASSCLISEILEAMDSADGQVILIADGFYSGT